MPTLEQLRADHASALLHFELTDRAYFAASISDRGDDFFEHFAEQHATRLAEQAAGTGAYHVLVDEVGAVVGRVNLTFISSSSATLGYRVAQAVAGHGVATSAVHELCGFAAERYGLRRIVASTSEANVASQRVLLKAGFHLVGPADPADVGGKAGYLYERLLQE